MSNNMPRQSREKSDTGIYHVMLRGINRQDIFEDEEDYRKMILFLRGLVERTDDNGLRIQPSCLIYSYCLMSNHLHLLVKEKDEGVSPAPAASPLVIRSSGAVLSAVGVLSRSPSSADGVRLLHFLFRLQLTPVMPVSPQSAPHWRQPSC